MVQIAPEDRPLDALRPNPANYNRHSPDAIEEMAAKIRVNGFTAPCIIRPDGMLLAGHLRRLALLRLRADSYPEPAGVAPGWIVPCRHYTGTEVNEKSVLVGDNPDPERTDFDGQALAALLAELQAADALEGSGYDEARLDSLIADLAEQSAAGGGSGLLPDADPDAVPESAPSRCQPGELWELGRHRIQVTDCRLESQGADTVLFDPPFDTEGAYEWVPGPAGRRALIVLTDAFRVADATLATAERGWRFRWELAWDGCTSWYVPGRPLARHKTALLFGEFEWRFDAALYPVADDDRKAGTVTNTRGSYAYTPDPRGKHLATVFEQPNVSTDEGHAHGKPVNWIRAMLAGVGANRVWDMCAGSGTGFVAAEGLPGVEVRGNELEPAIADVAITRWERATGELARRVGHSA